MCWYRGAGPSARAGATGVLLDIGSLGAQGNGAPSFWVMASACPEKVCDLIHTPFDDGHVLSRVDPEDRRAIDGH